MKNILSFLLMILISLNVFSQHGKVMESLEFESKFVKYPFKYSIYLPADYETSNRSYPVLYLLHGYSDDETGWIQFGEANSIVDRGVENGDFPPCIIVMPDGKVTWYCNDLKGEDRWEDMFIKEFIPFIESSYRIRSEKQFRAISGLSMGGNGSLLLAMRNPELFSTCVAMSAATFTDEEIIGSSQHDHFFGEIYGPKPKNDVSEHWKAYSPLHLLNTVDKDKLKSIRFYLDCGDDDFLFRGNAALHIKMKELGIYHEYRVRNGSHNWTYWRKSLFDGLVFISEKFHR